MTKGRTELTHCFSSTIFGITTRRGMSDRFAGLLKVTEFTHTHYGTNNVTATCCKGRLRTLADERQAENLCATLRSPTHIMVNDTDTLTKSTQNRVSDPTHQDANSRRIILSHFISIRTYKKKGTSDIGVR